MQSVGVLLSVLLPCGLVAPCGSQTTARSSESPANCLKSPTPPLIRTYHRHLQGSRKVHVLCRLSLIKLAHLMFGSLRPVDVTAIGERHSRSPIRRAVGVEATPWRALHRGENGVLGHLLPRTCATRYALVYRSLRRNKPHRRLMSPSLLRTALAGQQSPFN
jgi:hypothetical protein